MASTTSNKFTRPQNLLMVVFCKLVMNSTTRFLHPFVAFFAEDMDISVEKFTVSLLAVGEVASLISLSISKHAAKLESGTLAGLCHFLAGLFNLAVLLLPTTLNSNWSLGMMCFLRLGFGSCYNLALGAIQSSLASNVNFEQQGKFTGITESSWTLASLSFAAVGVLLTKAGWKAPFAVNGALILLSSPVIYMFLPSDKKQKKCEISSDKNKSAEVKPEADPDREGLPLLSRESLGLYGTLLFKDTGTYIILTVFSIWLDDCWSYGAEEAGFASLVIGCGEACAVVLMALFSDRIGIERCVAFVSFAIAGATTGLVIFESQNLNAALACFGVMFMFFEWGAISMIAYTGSSFSVNTRVSALSFLFCCMAVSRSVAAVIAEPMYVQLGMKGVVFSGAIMQVSAAVLFVCTRRRTMTESPTQAMLHWVERL